MQGYKHFTITSFIDVLQNVYMQGLWNKTLKFVEVFELPGTSACTRVFERGSTCIVYIIQHSLSPVQSCQGSCIIKSHAV